MKKRLLLFCLLGLWLLTSCLRADDSTPTPVTEPAPTIVPIGGQPAIVRHADLLNSPSQYSHALVQISGQYGRLPQLVCDGQVYRSPASWKLVAGEFFVQVAGFDSALRPLSGSDQTITVQGRWQRWEGLVGCGAEALPQEIWYLETLRVVEPNPILFGTPGPGEPVAIVEPTPDPGNGEGEPGEPPPEEPPPPPGEDEDDDDDFPGLPAPPGVTTPVPTPAITGTPTATAETTPGNGALTPTVTATPGENGQDDLTATPTATPNGAPSPPQPPSIEPQGDLLFEIVSKGKLAANSAHSWEINVTQTGVITVSVIADNNLNVMLSVERPDGSLAIDRQNDAGAGQVETVVFTANPSGLYTLLVATVSGDGSYGVLSLDDIAYDIVLSGNLQYGDNLNHTIPAETEQHWFFNATAGDTISIVVTPGGSNEFFIGLFDPEGRLIGSFAQSAGPGAQAALNNVLLTMTGYHSILVQEYFEDPAQYTIRLTRN